MGRGSPAPNGGPALAGGWPPPPGGQTTRGGTKVATPTPRWGGGGGGGGGWGGHARPRRLVQRWRWVARNQQAITSLGGSQCCHSQPVVGRELGFQLSPHHSRRELSNANPACHLRRPADCRCA